MHVSPAQTLKVEAFSDDVEGDLYVCNRHVAKRLGAKFLRGTMARETVLAVCVDELGNLFALHTNGQRKQYSPSEY